MSTDEVVRRRKQADITQAELGAELARMTGRRRPVSQKSISLWETGDADLPHMYTPEQCLEAIERIVARRLAAQEEGEER